MVNGRGTGLGSGPRGAGPPEERTGRPTESALTAMANAARRAREATGGLSSRVAPERAPRGQVIKSRAFRPPGFDSKASSESGSRFKPTHRPSGAHAGPGPGHRTRRIRLVETGIAVGLVVAALIITLTVGLSSGSHPSATVRTSSHPTTTVAPPTTAPSTTASAPPTTVAPSTTVTTAPPAPALPAATSPNAPQLSSISPAAGAPGQVVTVYGTNFVSANGVVVASFNGQQAGTFCSVLTACTVTVPSLGASPGNAVVTVTTAAGTSNGLAFSYT